MEVASTPIQDLFVISYPRVARILSAGLALALTIPCLARPEPPAASPPPEKVDTAPGNPTQGPSAPSSKEQAALSDTEVPKTTNQLSQRELAEEQLRAQQKQRILGVIPNFNTTDIQDAAPLSPRQKFRLFIKGAMDPFTFVAAGLDAGMSQANNNFPGYGQGAQGYAKRYGASYADQFIGGFWGNAVLPSLLHEDPRYFRKGSGGFKRRLLYSLSTSVITKKDNKTWGPNYSNIFGNLIAGGISNAYYPSSDRGLGLTFERALTITVLGMASPVFFEFWPDISKKFHQPKAKSLADDAKETSAQAKGAPAKLAEPPSQAGGPASK